MAYKIGETTWSMGDQITITTQPYEKHGETWQGGVDENGKAVTLPTPEQTERECARKRAEWGRQQVGFSRLKKLTT